ncbi:MAG: YybH family protein [Woeseiaceae bacterium]
MSQNMNADIDKLLDNYESAWNGKDFAALADLWHRAEPAIYYIAEEIDRPLHDFDAVLAYWEGTRTAVEAVHLSTSNRRWKSLTADLGVVTFEMHVDVRMAAPPQSTMQPIGSDVRVSAILRRTEAGWRFIHYVEAPIGALPFVRAIYNANVRSR